MSSNNIKSSGSGARYPKRSRPVPTSRNLGGHFQQKIRNNADYVRQIIGNHNNKFPNQRLSLNSITSNTNVVIGNPNKVPKETLENLFKNIPITINDNDTVSLVLPFEKPSSEVWGFCLRILISVIFLKINRFWMLDQVQVKSPLESEMNEVVR